MKHPDGYNYLIEYASAQKSPGNSKLIIAWDSKEDIDEETKYKEAKN